VAELPFDSDRKRMTTFHRPGPGAEKWAPGVARLGTIVAWTKGAPDVVLERCRFLLSPGGVRPLADADRSRIAEANQRLAAQALRARAVARRGWPGVPEPLDAEAAEQGLIFVGLVGMIDPPRPEAAESIREAKRAGIRTIMVTGDHGATAAAIAARLGLEIGRASGRERAQGAVGAGGVQEGQTRPCALGARA